MLVKLHTETSNHCTLLRDKGSGAACLGQEAEGFCAPSQMESRDLLKAWLPKPPPVHQLTHQVREQTLPSPVNLGTHTLKTYSCRQSLLLLYLLAKHPAAVTAGAGKQRDQLFITGESRSTSAGPGPPAPPCSVLCGTGDSAKDAGSNPLQK